MWSVTRISVQEKCNRLRMYCPGSRVTPVAVPLASKFLGATICSGLSWNAAPTLAPSLALVTRDYFLRQPNRSDPRKRDSHWVLPLHHRECGDVLQLCVCGLVSCQYSKDVSWYRAVRTAERIIGRELHPLETI